MRVWLAAIVWGVELLGACAHDETPKRELSEAVHAMNDATRWGRISAAAGLVEASYLARFEQAHSGWGEAIQVADTEVMRVDLAPDQQSAFAVVTYSWYNLQTMTLHNTVVRQQWVMRADRYILSAEEVVKGDVALFAPPEPG